MLIKVHKSYRYVIAICDSELLGKTYEEGKRILDIRQSFYGGEGADEVDEEKLLELLDFWSKEDATFIISGEKSTQTAIKSEIITQDAIKTIQGIPFTLLLL